MTPPRIAEEIIRRVTVAEDRELVLTDLRRRFAELADERGTRAARVWYWRQSLSAVGWRLRSGATGRGGSGRFRVSRLDLRLAGRMLVKYPALTVVGGLAIAFAVWVGAVTFEVVGQMIRPQLPLEDGDRVVAILERHRDRDVVSAPRLSEFAWLRTELTSVSGLAAYRDVSRNLSIEGGATQPLDFAQISPIGLGLPGVSPILGRALVEEDARPGAPPVLVLGHDTWTSRFDADREAVGAVVSLGGVQTTVVGVMPEGFAFPKSHHAWTPLVVTDDDLLPGSGPLVIPFGRLAPGQSFETAQAELSVISEQRAALRAVEDRERWPEVMPYALALEPIPDVGPLGLLAANIFVAMLFVLICGSVAMLVWARTTTRRRELAVRSALGAGPKRIASQLFVEALVLTGLAAAVGLALADLGVGWYGSMVEADSGPRPFWARDGVALTTVAYAGALTIAGAALVGLIPAFKVTRRDVGTRIRAASRDGAISIRGIWALVIAAQVAVTVAFPATSFLFQRFVSEIQAFDLGLTGQAYVAARIESAAPDASATDDRGRRAELNQELRERLLQDPAVVGVAFAEDLPGMMQNLQRIALETSEGPVLVPRRVGAKSVAPGFFSEMSIPLLEGRAFGIGDLEGPARIVVVDEAFVEQVLGGRAAVGRRIRLADPRAEAGPWVEIVGVVGGLAMLGGDNLSVEPAAGLYFPAPEGSPAQENVAVQLAGASVEEFIPRLQAAALAVDAELQLRDVHDLTRISESLWRESEFLYQILAGISLVAVMLSLMGIYSVLSLTVSQRTREIGIRMALGSSSHRVVLQTLGLPLAVVCVGIGLGGALVLALAAPARGGLTPAEVGWVGVYAVAMLGVCATACIAPTRRALSIEPTEAFRVEL